MSMYELTEKSTVSVYGADIGGVDNPEVLKLLRYSGESEWSEKLREYIEDWYYEYNRCPICGRIDFYYHRELLPGVSVGFCRHCKEDIINNQGKIEHLRSGKSGVLVEHNKVFRTTTPRIKLGCKV